MERGAGVASSLQTKFTQYLVFPDFYLFDFQMETKIYLPNNWRRSNWRIGMLNDLWLLFQPAFPSALGDISRRDETGSRLGHCSCRNYEGKAGRAT